MDKAPSTEELAVAFVIALRMAGHSAHVDQSGRFSIRLGVTERTRPAPEHHLGPGYAYTLGFDERSFAALVKDSNWIAKLIAATREVGAAFRQEPRQ